MTARPRRFAAGLLVSAALGAGVLGLTGCGSSSSAPASPAASVSTSPSAPATAPLDVTLGKPSELAMTVSAATAPAGPLTFHVTNAGTTTHEFVVIRSARSAAMLPMEKGRAGEGGNVGETGDMKAGAAQDLTLTLPAGHYALICNLPGHYAGGMHADLTVR